MHFIFKSAFTFFFFTYTNLGCENWDNFTNFLQPFSTVFLFLTEITNLEILLWIS